MNKKEQLDFVDQLINMVHKQIIEQVNTRAPDSWDGMELRQFIADGFSEVVTKGAMSKRRRILYNHSKLIMPR